MAPFTARAERLRERGGTKSEGKSFLGSTMESKESEQKRREREKSTCGADRATQIGSPPEMPILQPTLHLRTDTRRVVPSHDATDRLDSLHFESAAEIGD